MSDDWWQSQRNLGGLADYMARVRGDNARTVAEAMEKPWKFPEVWTEYLTALDADVETSQLLNEGDGDA